MGKGVGGKQRKLMERRFEDYWFLSFLFPLNKRSIMLFIVIYHYLYKKKTSIDKEIKYNHMSILYITKPDNILGRK